MNGGEIIAFSHPQLDGSHGSTFAFTMQMKLIDNLRHESESNNNNSMSINGMLD